MTKIVVFLSDYITEIIRNPQKSDMLEEKDGNSEVEQMRLNDLLEQEVLKGATAVAGRKRTHESGDICDDDGCT